MQTSPVKAIREYCLGCCLESAYEVKLCPDDECPLYAFRFDKNPYTTRTYTDDQKQAMADRAKNLQRKQQDGVE